jgi:hypothetical protein
VADENGVSQVELFDERCQVVGIGVLRQDNGMAERLMLHKIPVGRNTLLLSAGMAALYGMVQLWAAVTRSLSKPSPAWKDSSGWGRPYS